MRTIGLAAGVLLACAPLHAFAQANSPSPATTEDQMVIEQIVANLEADQPDPHVSAKLDWENAFGIRYFDLKKRDAFYGSVVKPQFKSATDTTLETKVQFVTPALAVADTYWHVAGQVYAGQQKAGPDRWGRTTYIFKKDNGAWVEVIERVADLRLPYYKHLSEAPKAAPVAAAILKSYAGRYASLPPNSKPLIVDVGVSDGHLTLSTARGILLAIPTSDTDFLAFVDAKDTAQYYKVKFHTQDGVTTYTLSEAWGEPIGTLQKQP